MAENTPQNASSPAEAHAPSFVDALKNDFLPKHGTKLLVGALVLVVGVVGYTQYQKSVAAKEVAQAEVLGKGFDHLYNGRTDSGLVVLEGVVNGGEAKGLTLAKAALLTANLHLQKGEYDVALKQYQLSLDNAGDVELIASGALHGLATATMEKKDYAGATKLLEKFVSTYGKRTGDLKARYAKEEPVDAVTTVPDALWKLSLCYAELGQKEQAKASAEKLVKIYGSSRQALQAKKLLASL